jgi:hypothetical protein
MIEFKMLFHIASSEACRMGGAQRNPLGWNKYENQK